MVPSLDDTTAAFGVRIAVRRDLSGAELAQATAALSPDDHRIAASRPPARAAGFVTGRFLLRGVLEADPTMRSAVVPAPVCARCGGPHGPLRGADWSASISHSAGITAVAWMSAAEASRSGVSAIGVDIETIGDETDLRERASGVAAVCGVRDRDPLSALRRWTRIEAALKVDGRGLEVAPTSVRIEEGPDAAVARLDDRPDERIELFDVDAGPAVVATLALGRI